MQKLPIHRERVRQYWPEAVCEPSYSGKGFTIWDSSKVGVPTVEMLGQGETELLAWIDAQRNIETYGMPKKVGGAPHYYPLDRKNWGPLQEEKTDPKKNFRKWAWEIIVGAVKEYFRPLTWCWNFVRGK